VSNCFYGAQQNRAEQSASEIPIEHEYKFFKTRKEMGTFMNAYEIEKINISGFRRLYSVELLMKPFMVMIGANGVGKTSVLDTLSLLSASASGNLNSTLSQKGGVANLLTRNKSQNMSFLVEMKVPNYQPFKYELMIEPTASGYTISNEILSQNRGRPDPFRHIESAHGDIRYFDINEKSFLRPSWEHNPFETSLAQVPKMFKEPEELRRILATANQYHVLDVSTRAPVKLPQAMKPAHLPGIDGEDLTPFLYYLRESDQNRFDAVIDTLRAAFPDFDTLSFPPISAGMLTMTWNDKKFAKPIYIHELSEGMLRFIWLVSLLHSPHLSTITMIDEPEVSLHPELLGLLVEVMREASKRTQLVIATHSDRLVRFLRPEEVVVMDINEEGNTNAASADSMDLDAWLAEYSLDEVWRMGRMGGRA
jgi:predicted ATPase